MARHGGAVLLGVVQGLTEFLPVSSSGHLVLGSVLLGLHQPDLLFDIILHVGTLLPVLWLYRADVGQMTVALTRLPRARQLWADDLGLRLLGCVALGSVPTALIGFGLHDTFERLFASASAVGVALVITGALLLVTRWRPGVELDARAALARLTPGRALLVGIAQGMAITPGISRSGSTIATCLLLGMEREMAARFSFLLALPAIVGAALLQLRKFEPAAGQLTSALIGAIAAAAAGYLALRWVVAFVRRGQLHWFALYVIPLGIGVLIYTGTR